MGAGASAVLACLPSGREGSGDERASRLDERQQRLALRLDILAAS